MPDTFFISDTHFGHAACLTFKQEDGSPLRPFSCVEEMDQTLIQNWNNKVKPEDKVYHLGDVSMHKKCLKILERLNGRKTLICGNHDIFYTKEYTKYFENIRAYKVYPKHGIIMSHIPVHPQQLEHRFSANVHGHLHSNFIKDKWGNKDKRYLNICVENTNYTPLAFEEILSTLYLENFNPKKK